MSARRGRTGVLHALADRKDAWHRGCADFVEKHEGRLLMPSTVIPEVCHLMGTYLGRHVERALVKALADGESTVVHLTADRRNYSIFRGSDGSPYALLP